MAQVPIYELLLQLDADGKLKHVWPNGAEGVAVDPRGDRVYLTGSDRSPDVRAFELPADYGTEPGRRRDRLVTGKSASVGTADLASGPVDRVVDPGLLARAAAGEVAAFDEILRPRLARLYRMAVAITRSEPDARDAVQDASLNAWRELPRLRSPERFDSWLDQILVNACRSLMRRSRRVVVREIDLEAAGAGDDADGFGSRLTRMRPRSTSSGGRSTAWSRASGRCSSSTTSRSDRSGRSRGSWAAPSGPSSGASRTPEEP